MTWPFVRTANRASGFVDRETKKTKVVRLSEGEARAETAASRASSFDATEKYVTTLQCEYKLAQRARLWTLSPCGTHRVRRPRRRRAKKN
jgi:hypothetical protein